jgi:hypothetical protein
MPEDKRIETMRFPYSLDTALRHLAPFRRFLSRSTRCNASPNIGNSIMKLIAEFEKFLDDEVNLPRFFVVIE